MLSAIADQKLGQELFKPKSSLLLWSLIFILGFKYKTFNARYLSSRSAYRLLFSINHSSPRLEIKCSFSLFKYRVYGFLCN